MTTAAQQTLETPVFRYNATDMPELNIGAGLYAGLGTGKPAHVHVPKSGLLAWKTTFNRVGRDLIYGIGDAHKLPEPAKQAGLSVYQDAQLRRHAKMPYAGTWHRDAVLPEPEATITGSIRPKNCVAAKYFQNIKGFKKNPDGTYDIDPLDDTIEERLWLPKGGARFIVPGEGHDFYNPFGLPVETIGNEKTALRRIMKTGLTMKQARNELSRFHMVADKGLRAVLSYSSAHHGSLCIDVSFGPEHMDPNFVSFPASSAAKRSKVRPKNNDAVYRGREGAGNALQQAERLAETRRKLRK